MEADSCEMGGLRAQLLRMVSAHFWVSQIFRRSYMVLRPVDISLRDSYLLLITSFGRMPHSLFSWCPSESLALGESHRHLPAWIGDSSGELALVDGEPVFGGGGVEAGLF